VALTVLYRKNEKWNLWQSGISLAGGDAAFKRCQTTTASPWVWIGPDTLGSWRLLNQGSDAVPARVVATARRVLDDELAKARAGVKLGEEMLVTLKPKQRKPPRGQAAESGVVKVPRKRAR